MFVVEYKKLESEKENRKSQVEIARLNLQSSIESAKKAEVEFAEKELEAEKKRMEFIKDLVDKGYQIDQIERLLELAKKTA